MALNLASIGAAVGRDLGRVVRSGAKSLGHDVRFGVEVARRLENAAADSGVLQLAGMLQTGTPMGLIVDRIANRLTDALAKASGKQIDSGARRTLMRALTAALAPPGTSPPGTSPPFAKLDAETALQQAKGLEGRLGDLLSRLASQGTQSNDAGQQKRFPGPVLDADTARELPAQQTPPTTTANDAAAIDAFAESLLNRSAAPNAPSAAAPDVLARMLIRAANAGSQRVQTSQSETEPTAQTALPSAHSATPVPASATLFARLIAAVEQNRNETGGGHADSKPSNGGDTVPQTQPAQSNAPAIAAPAATAPSAPAATSTVFGAQTPQTPYTSVDPQAVIEQVVKGIVMRNSGTTSEVRLRLQPEQLGDVALKLTVTGTTIAANVVAQNAHVREMLLANAHQLARSLAESGLSLGSFSVDVSGGNPGFTQQQSSQPRSLGKAGGFGALMAGEDESRSDSRFGPPLLGGVRPWALNYLA